MLFARQFEGYLAQNAQFLCPQLDLFEQLGILQG
jgi:hypothetical protein